MGSESVTPVPFLAFSCSLKNLSFRYVERHQVVDKGYEMSGVIHNCLSQHMIHACQLDGIVVARALHGERDGPMGRSRVVGVSHRERARVCVAK